MAIIGKRSLNNKWLLEVDADPRDSGVQAPLGSLALYEDGVSGYLFVKNGPGDTNWQQGDLDFGPPVTQLPDQPNYEGTSSRAARADHEHFIPTGVPVDVLPEQGNVSGTSLEFARADHQHNAPTGVPVDIGLTNEEGVSGAFARADHVHAHGSQPGGLLHAPATQSVAGFMSATDKTKVDLLPGHIKAGKKSGASFTGSPRKSAVVFATPFSSLNYTVSFEGHDGRAWQIEDQTASGFVINSDAAQAVSGEVHWQAIEVNDP